MKYTLICFTFNKVKRTPEYQGEDWNHFRLELRNNWIDEIKDGNQLDDALVSLGFDYAKIQDAQFKIATEHVVKLFGDFTLPNTRIIVHIVKN